MGPAGGPPPALVPVSGMAMRQWMRQCGNTLENTAVDVSEAVAVGVTETVPETAAGPLCGQVTAL
eukprot:11227039-Lingulodinium_polyedra.AAC.1